MAGLLDAKKEEVNDRRPPSLNHPEIHRTTSEPKGSSPNEERPHGIRANTFHVQGDSELEGSGPRAHNLSEQDRGVARVLSTRSSRWGLTQRPSCANLNCNSAPVTQASTPLQAGEQLTPPQTISSPRVPSLLVTSTAPEQSELHDLPVTPTSTLASSLSEPSNYATESNVSGNTTPRSSLSMRPTSHTSDSFDKAIDVAIQESME